MEAKMQITLRVQNEKKGEWLPGTFTYLGSTVWTNKVGQPTLYLQVVDDQTGQFSLRKATLCRAVVVGHIQVKDPTKPKEKAIVRRYTV